MAAAKEDAAPAKAVVKKAKNVSEKAEKVSEKADDAKAEKVSDTKPQSATVAVKKYAPKGKAKYNDGRLAIVRIKPLGAGGGGGEKSAASGEAGLHQTKQGVAVIGGARKKLYTCVSACANANANNC